MALIAEDLLLLLLDDETGELRGSSQIQVALGGAVLSELAIEGRVEVEEKKGFWHTAKVRPLLGSPAHPLLAEAHATISEKERSAQDLVSRLGKGLKDRITTELVGRGVVREEKDKVLGLFPRTRWPAADSTHEQEVRRDIDATLLQGQPPEVRTGALIALLHAIDQAHKVIPHEGMSNGDLKKRAKAVAEGDWAAKGVTDAIAAANAAIVAATMAATTAATTASSS